MQERTRTIVSRIRAFIGNRRRARRHPARLTCSLTPADRHVTLNGYGRTKWMDGHTSDMSSTGLGVIVPAIRIGEHYLVGDERKLRLRLDLPIGPIEMQVKPVRYESLEETDSENGYVIGVQIIAMVDTDRTAYDKFLKRILNQAPLD
jgi:PilZ domain-containing protein